MTATPPVLPGERLAALDGLRGLAILLVLVYHYTVRWTPPEDPANHLAAAAVFKGLPVVGQFGWAGVSLFFMISGFVIHMTLERSRSVINFAIRRLARLWPPMLAGCTLTAAVLLAIGPVDWRPTLFEYALSILFIPPALIGEAIGRPETYTWVDGVYWTLFVEVRFYVMAALIWLLWPKRFLEIVVAFAMVGLGLYLLADSISPLAGQIVDLFTFAREAAYFAFGALAYAYWRGSRGALIWSGLAACACLTFIIAGASATRLVLNTSALILMSAVFIFHGRGMAPFARGPLPFIGRISYSFYLLHQMIGVSLLIVLTQAGLSIGPAIALVSAVMILASWAQFRLVEIPGRDWMTKHLKAPELRMVERWPSLAYTAPERVEDVALAVDHSAT